MTAEILGVFRKPTFSVSYLVVDPATRHGVVIDPVRDYDHRPGHTSTGFADALIEELRRHEVTVDWLLETHMHADHLSAQACLKEKLARPPPSARRRRRSRRASRRSRPATRPLMPRCSSCPPSRSISGAGVCPCRNPTARSI
jgi:glyoxylase-like metal-dependent hydrolase (beta-lactamase superfamily II)